jgi:hypothetical protein
LISKCSIIISCQSFIQLKKFLKPSSIQWNTIFGCMDLFTQAKRMAQMFNATLWRSDVAWSHNSMLAPFPCSIMILAISSCKQIRGLIHGLGKRTFKHMNIVLTTVLIHGCKPPNVNNANLFDQIFVVIFIIESPSSNYKYVRSTNMDFKPPQWVPK